MYLICELSFLKLRNTRLGGSAFFAAPVGARWAHHVSGTKLAFYMGIFMLLIAPLVYFKSLFISSEEEEKDQKKELNWTKITPFYLILVGTVAGLSSGAFGIGGGKFFFAQRFENKNDFILGVIVVPCLSMIASQQLSLGLLF